jgi:hypothetical protein
MSEQKTITSKALIGYYGVTGKEFTHVRKMLQMLAHIQPVWQGSQTYYLYKDLPASIEELEQEYRKVFYTLPVCEAFDSAIYLLVNLIPKMQASHKSEYKEVREAVKELADVQLTGETSILWQPVHDSRLTGTGARSHAAILANAIALLQAIYKSTQQVSIKKVIDRLQPLGEIQP